jgi:serine protease Do
VQVHAGAGGAGSGIVWSGDGVIVTNAHVARGKAAEVELWDGRRFPAELMARDRVRDLAALRVKAGGLEPAEAGDSGRLRAGEMVIAVGSPYGFAGALSRGVVHSKGPIAGMGRQEWIRADVRLAPGNSGGPLADACGRVVGVNTAIVNGLGVAAPAAAVARVLGGKKPRELGVTLRPVGRGLLILQVEAGGAAEGASLRAGDVLLCSMGELEGALEGEGEVVRLRFVRGRGEGAGTAVREVAVRLEAA